MLRACKRLLRRGGRLAYLTIIVSDGLTPIQAKEAIRLGPRAVAASAPDEVLMERAGFTDVRVSDLSSSFLEVARSWTAQFTIHATALKSLFGEEEWEERQSNRAGLSRGVEDGLLRRISVEGTRP